MFGRFALDVERSAIWFDETLLGEEFREEELRFAIRMLASTADEWDDRLKQMFGGFTYQEMLGSSTLESPKTQSSLVKVRVSISSAPDPRSYRKQIARRLVPTGDVRIRAWTILSLTHISSGRESSHLRLRVKVRGRTPHVV